MGFYLNPIFLYLITNYLQTIVIKTTNYSTQIYSIFFAYLKKIYYFCSELEII